MGAHLEKGNGLLVAFHHLAERIFRDLPSDVKALMGQRTQPPIHDKLIEKAKEQLSTTRLTVSELAYELGFEHLQSFNKLFKAKTILSPISFRRTFQ